MFSRQNPKQIFLSALLLLVFSGITTSLTIYKLYVGEHWVRHTFRVQLLTHEIETNLAKAGRSRQGFVTDGDPKYLGYLEEARVALRDEFAELQNLTSDNRDQQTRNAKLQEIVQERMAQVDRSVALAQSQKSDSTAQAAITADIVESAFKTTTLTEEINTTEEALLDRRIGFTKKLSVFVVVILAATFLLSLYLFWEYYRLLAAELEQRKKAEQDAQRLSGEVLRAQDEERRRIARELHDGLGQTITGAKMVADAFVHRPPTPGEVQELIAILEEAMSATRTLSHLLHPPLLDEIGFMAAARWFIEGFAKRTGIVVEHDIPIEDTRFSAPTELTLFRILQESLMNVQRHANSTRAKVGFSQSGGSVRLKVQDFGVGLAAEKLARFSSNGTAVGVGLAGMKQRVQEQAGTLTLASDKSGTTVTVTLPAVAI